ncbi:MAG TPA: hypothetical protein VFB13_18105 [Reyranella sp.]|nr:hypothetical protein [Reyranella sp.]
MHERIPLPPSADLVKRHHVQGSRGVARVAVVTIAAALAFAGPALAQDRTVRIGELPAVSALNGKVSVESGVAGEAGRSSAVGLASGSITAPLGHAFGLQLDANGFTDDAGFTGGGTLHTFWRDSALGLAGPFAALEGGPEGRLGWYGGEAELYAGLFTLGGEAGYRDSAAAAIAEPSGGFWGSHLTLYPVPDLALTAGVDSQLGEVAAIGAIEVQPTLLGRHNIAFFANATAGDASSYSATVGIRLYFGADKTLIRRHREDDPSTPPVNGFDITRCFNASTLGGLPAWLVRRLCGL